jgi:hypothetical protein
VDLVDADRERVAGARASDLDRPRERVARVELLVARLEALARCEIPAGVRNREAHRVAGLDGQHGLEVAREVAVERPPLERQLVDGHYGRSVRTAAAMRSTDGM